MRTEVKTSVSVLVSKVELKLSNIPHTVAPSYGIEIRSFAKKHGKYIEQDGEIRQLIGGQSESLTSYVLR